MLLLIAWNHCGPGGLAGAANFEPPGEEQRLRAAGHLDGLPETLRRAFTPGSAFEPVPEPGPHDWLANHSEPGQTFAEFTEEKPHRPEGSKRILYLVALGEFPDNESPSLALLKDYAQAFFGLEVRTLPPLALDELEIGSRVNAFTRKRQLLSIEILERLRTRLPKDAFCLLGMTMEDLYPDPSWNFVFGQASLTARVGVYSFARYHAGFLGRSGASRERNLLDRRSCKVLSHETGHMFGLQHCIYYRCVMNGSNRLQESDARPLHLCPVCLRKLHWSVGFDVVERYRRLAALCERAGFEDEQRWMERRLEELGRP